MAHELGNKIKTLRKLRGMSQEDLGDKLNLRRSTISNWEIGRRNPSLKDLERLSDALGVGLDYFGYEEEKGVYDLISRARMAFEDDSIPMEEKAKAYKEIMRLYLQIED